VLVVEPQTTEGGSLSFDWPDWDALERFVELTDEGSFSLLVGSFVLRVQDHQSGESIEIDVPGEWAAA
jgi:hypothetical protein